MVPTTLADLGWDERQQEVLHGGPGGRETTCGLLDGASFDRFEDESNPKVEFTYPERKSWLMRDSFLIQ